MPNNKRMLMFKAFLKDTNQTEEEYEANTKGKFNNDDNNIIPICVPLINYDNEFNIIQYNNNPFIPVVPFIIKIKCSQLKISQRIVYNNKVWEIKNFNKLTSKTLISFICMQIPSEEICFDIAFAENYNFKKEFIFPKEFIFEINKNGYIIIN
jgi:hypothetical protein